MRAVYNPESSSRRELSLLLNFEPARCLQPKYRAAPALPNPTSDPTTMPTRVPVSRPLASTAGGGEAIATVGTDSTVTPSAVEAASVVARLEESEVCTAVAVVEAGTAMLAVMITLAAATLIVTSDLSMPAAAATLCCKLEVSE